MNNDDIQEKRLRARLALEGDERHAKREQSAAEIAKQREEAMLAMEGAERKNRREAKIKAEAEAADQEQRRLAEIEKIKELEEARKKDAEFKALVEEQRLAKEKETKVEKIHQAEAKIEDLKQAPAISITSVRTLQSDLNQAVERRKMSATSIAVQNQSQKNISFAEEEPKSYVKTILTITLVVILIAAGGGALWYAQKIRSGNPAPLVNPNTPKLIISENTEIFEIASSTSANQIQTSIKEKLANTGGQITNFYFTTQTPDPENPEQLKTVFITPAKFVELSGVNINDGLTRSIGDTFTLGSIQSPQGQVPFMIMQIAAYDRVLARMFDWERTMATDLGAIWPGAVASTTLNSSFSNKRINNLDARILYYENQQPALAYIFFNNKYIIIAQTDQVFTDIMARLAP